MVMKWGVLVASHMDMKPLILPLTIGKEIGKSLEK